MFQSLSGVLGVCNAVSRARDRSITRFQSLSGVLGVCNLAEAVGAKEKISIVSIPFRGFRCLQLQHSICVPRNICSFNPFQGF